MNPNYIKDQILLKLDFVSSVIYDDISDLLDELEESIVDRKEPAQVTKEDALDYLDKKKIKPVRMPYGWESNILPGDVLMAKKGCAKALQPHKGYLVKSVILSKRLNKLTIKVDGVDGFYSTRNFVSGFRM